MRGRLPDQEKRSDRRRARQNAQNLIAAGGGSRNSQFPEAERHVPLPVCLALCCNALMIRDHASCVTLLTICLALNSTARATTSSPTNSESKAIDVWTDGFAKADADKIVGIALGLSGPLRVEGKLGVQQHANPRLANTEKVVWSVARPAAYQLGKTVDLNVSSGGTLDSLHGSYVQSLTGTMTWTAQSN